MELDAIYAPIQGGLEQVEEQLQSLRQTRFTPLSPLLELVAQHKGKRLRPALTLLAGKLYHYQPRTLLPMATALELFHTATLIHDDIVDGSSLRRGRPTVNSVWGNEAALLLGDYLFAISAQRVAATENLRVIQLFGEMLMNISGSELGQSLVSADRRASYPHYLEWVGNKTASVFATAAQSGAILSLAPEEAVTAMCEYGYNLGIAFQMADDILDFIGQEGDLGKPVGADLLQGHPTLPTILFLEHHPRGQELKEMLRGPVDREALKGMVALISHSSVMAECFGVAREFSGKAEQALRGLPEGEVRRALSALTQYVVARRR